MVFDIFRLTGGSMGVALPPSFFQNTPADIILALSRAPSSVAENSANLSFSHNEQLSSDNI